MPRDDLTVRAAGPADVDDCARVIAGLPDHFTPDVVAQVRRDMAGHRSWVITESGRTVGFAVVASRFRAAAEILWVAVEADRRGNGIGSRLNGVVLDALAESGTSLVEVKTLDPSAGYEPYGATHAFWLARGFLQIDTIDPLPGWQPGNPAAVLVAAGPRS